jgi:hypothetical protein
MKVRGDIEAVNLSTGERWRRVSGDGESLLEKVDCVLEDARKAVKPIVDREREAEKNIGDLLDMRLD